jgi:hypothetical protein
LTARVQARQAEVRERNSVDRKDDVEQENSYRPTDQDKYEYRCSERGEDFDKSPRANEAFTGR